MSHFRHPFALLILLLLAGLACTLTPTGNSSPTEPAAAPTEVANTTPDTAAQNGANSGQNGPVASQFPTVDLELEGTLIALYQQVNPSVVHILVYASSEAAVPLGSGTGFVYDALGRVVTNNHVVESGRRLEIVFADQQRRFAAVIGADVDSDLAIIQVEAMPEGVQPLSLGDSNAVQVGQLVAAIGNPFGEQSSMSMGIISGVNRSLESQRVLESGGTYSLPQVIQTDAPINPGNSGGPLLNLQGEVIGVNSAIRSISGVNSGVGFAIPVNALKRIIPSLIENGEYVYPFMGVEIRDLNLALQEQLNLPQVNGAYVVGVTAGGPAAQAGLSAADQTTGQGGDLIIAVNGNPVNQFADLISYLVFETEVGQTVELTVLRDSQAVTVPLTLGARP